MTLQVICRVILRLNRSCRISLRLRGLRNIHSNITTIERAHVRAAYDWSWTHLVAEKSGHCFRMRADATHLGRLNERLMDRLRCCSRGTVNCFQLRLVSFHLFKRRTVFACVTWACTLLIKHLNSRADISGRAQSIILFFHLNRCRMLCLTLR